MTDEVPGWVIAPACATPPLARTSAAAEATAPAAHRIASFARHGPSSSDTRAGRAAWAARPGSAAAGEG